MRTSASSHLLPVLLVIESGSSSSTAVPLALVPGFEGGKYRVVLCGGGGGAGLAEGQISVLLPPGVDGGGQIKEPEG